MTRIILGLMCCLCSCALLAGAARAQTAQSCSARNPLIGTWRVVSFEDRTSSSEAWVVGYGGQPVGYLIYTDACKIAFQVSGPLRRDAGLVGSELGAHGYSAYFGSYRTDSNAGTVTHRVEGALQPMPDNEARPFVLRGDTLVLGNGRTWRRTFVRVR